MKRFLLALFLASVPAFGATEKLVLDTKTHVLTGETGGTVIDAKGVTLTLGGFTISDASGVKTIILGSTSGTKIGATGDKLGLLGATPVIRQTGNLLTALTAYGLINSPSLTIANVTSLQAALDAKAVDTATVHKTGAETVAGVKTFSSAPVVPSASFPEAAITNLTTDLGLRALDSAVVHTSAFNGLGDARYPQLTGSYANPSWITSIPFSKLTTTPTTVSGYGITDNTFANLGSKPTTLSGFGITDPVALLTAPQTFTAAQSFYSIDSNSVVATVLTTPGAPIVTHTGTAGATTWTYVIVAKLSDGSSTPAGPTGSTTTGNATLDNSNYNNLSWTAVTGAASYDIYRTVHGLVPSTLGQITNVSATTYSDKGAAGDTGTAPTANTTGQVSGSITDGGGQVLNVKSPRFAGGAKADGVTDDAPAINAAIATLTGVSGADIYLPPGNYRLASPILVSGYSRNLRGAGKESTVLIPDLNVTSAIRLGNRSLGSPYSDAKVSDLTINRAAGTPPSGVMGIDADFVSHVVIEDVSIYSQDIALRTDHDNNSGNSSIHLTLNRVHTFFCAAAHIWLRNIAVVRLNDCYLARSGDTVATTDMIVIDGTTNDVVVYGTTAIPTAPANTTTIVRWKNIPSNSSGVFSFIKFNTEQGKDIFASDASALIINQLSVTNSRLTSGSGKVWNFNASTALTDINFSNNPAISTVQNASIAGALKSRFQGNYVTGTLTFSSGDWIVSGNTFTTDTVFTGAFAPLVLVANEAVFNGITPIALDTSGATGIITSIGNTKDAGTQPLTILPADIAQGTWTASVSFLTGGWSNITGAETLYRSERSGIVRLSGSIHSVTGGSTLNAGVIWLNALPVGFRPTRTVTFSVPCGTSTANVSIDVNGIGRLDTAAPSGTNITLDGITFSTN
ncbi:MAG: hypothetical protein QOE26_2764 [Verrucomicrobiota bacterium]|jgi:hypothetical protein